MRPRDNPGMPIRKLLLLCLLPIAIGSAGAASAQTTMPGAESQGAAAGQRPRVGLVLSGGGARGLAHVGVLKVLERERVPIDVIAGTSMGSIIGGLYASGMSADDIEVELRKVDWDALFATRIDRAELSQRRREQDFIVTPAIEFGIRDGSLSLPLGARATRGLELLLRRYTLPVRTIDDFDDLPTPFRAVATDMESGQPIVLGAGDLAMAMRSSMSVPGAFAPTEVDGRILGDGGLVNNLPIDVARAMGADVVIVVNIGTPLSGRDSLGSIVGVTVQMISILTEQNVRRSLDSMEPGDLLIAPQLGELTSRDFARTAEFVDLGKQQADAQTQQIRAFAVGPAEYAQWLQTRARPKLYQPALDFVRFEGSEITNPERFAAALETQPGATFDPAAAERDARRLGAGGDYSRVDFRLDRDGQGGEGLVFVLEDKNWGPNYFRIGLSLDTDFSGESRFNIKLSHDRHWLDDRGSEWRNVLQIGSSPYWFTEYYRPLKWVSDRGWDWFVSPTAQVGREQFTTFAGPEGGETGRLRRTGGRVGIDLGQTWGSLGELRVGPYWQRLTDKPLVVSADFNGSDARLTRTEFGLRARVVLDQLDNATFPSGGYRLAAEVAGGNLTASDDLDGSKGDDNFSRGDIDAALVFTPRKGHTLLMRGLGAAAGGGTEGGLGIYTLGGFQRLSGYLPGQIEGNYMLFGRLTYQYLLSTPALTRGFVAGVSAEVGNAWNDRSAMRLSDLRSGYSLFLGADTGVGPLYLGLVYAPRGSTGVWLFLGRP